MKNVKEILLNFILVNLLRGCISHHSFRTKTQVHIRKQVFPSLINIHTILILPSHKIRVSTNVHNVHIQRDTKKTWKWWYTVCVSIRLLLRGHSCEISYQSHSPTKKSKEFTLNRRVIDELFTLTYWQKLCTIPLLHDIF